MLDLAQIPDSPRLIDPLKLNHSGVDFLNLRQVNLDLMARCFPGIGNVTQQVRPYSLMCWAHWKIAETYREQGREEITVRAIEVFREKIESLVVWGAQEAELGGVPGSSSPRPPSADGAIPLDFKSWKRAANNTSYLAAVQYGPSLGDLGGLGYLHWDQQDIPRVTAAGEQLARAYDAAIRGDPSYAFLSDPGLAACDESTATAAFRLVHPFEASPAEQSVFRDHLYSTSAIDDLRMPLGRRSASFRRVLDVLEAGLEPKDIDAVREAMAFGSTPEGRPVASGPGPSVMGKFWALLQIRQLQRLAFEGLLAWVERLLLERGTPLPPDDIIEDALGQLADHGGWERNAAVGQILAAVCEPMETGEQYQAAFLYDPDRISPVRRLGVLADLTTAARPDMPALLAESMRALFLIARSCPWMLADPDLKAWTGRGGAERVSVAHWHGIIAQHTDSSLGSLIDIVLKNLVISQHFAVGTDRYDGERIRLRLILDEHGIDFLRGWAWQPRPTPDRLAAAISLMRGCGMV